MSIRIEHIAMWVQNLEEMRDFYVNRFNGKAGLTYHNPAKNFTSYFITFDSGCRLELMHRPGIPKESLAQNRKGLNHIAFSVGCRQRMDQLTKEFRDNGYTIAGEPRLTGNGYYESVIEDPEGNLVEITS